MARLDIERQKELEPKRMVYAKEHISKLGYKITFSNDTYLIFEFKNYPVRFYPYSGWHSGRSITDGRGLSKLLKQIKTA